jgi:CCR4-NOT transcription complex subunit 1
MLIRATPEILDFVAALVRECSLTDRACVPRNGFAASLAAMIKASESGRSTPAVDALLEDLRGGVEDDKPTIDNKLQERLKAYFLEWVHTVKSDQNPEVSFGPYIIYLQREGILKGEDVSSAFYRTAINCAVDHDVKSGGHDGVDSLAKLILLIVKNHGEKTGESRGQTRCTTTIRF